MLRALLPMGLVAMLLFPFMAVGCTPGSGTFVLEPLHGRVVDLETGAPIANAEIIEWYVGGGPSDGARPVHHARWATSDATGAFVLPRSRASVQMLAGLSYGPRFAMVHPDYGLQRQAREGPDGWLLQGDKRRAEVARQDLQPYCRGELDDPGARRIREVACGPARGRD